MLLLVIEFAFVLTWFVLYLQVR